MNTQQDLDIITTETNTRYARHFQPGLDRITIVLKAHLFTEELLQEIIFLHCRDTTPLEGLQLAYALKAKLAQAMFGAHIPNLRLPGEVWPTLSALNKLRNELAHQLDSVKAQEKLFSFILLAKALSKAPSSLTLTDLETWPDENLTAQLTEAVMGVLGYLGALRAIAFLNTPRQFSC